MSNKYSCGWIIVVWGYDSYEVLSTLGGERYIIHIHEKSYIKIIMSIKVLVIIIYHWCSIMYLSLTNSIWHDPLSKLTSNYDDLTIWWFIIHRLQVLT